jgi:hypothetical protein
VLLNPRQVNALHEIADGDDSLGRDGAAVDGGHVPPGFSLDVCGWPLPPGVYWAELMTYPLPFHIPGDVAPLPVSDIPAVPDSDDLSILLTVTH